MSFRVVHANEPVDPAFVEFVVESFPNLDPAAVREDLNRPWVEVDEPDDVPAPVIVPDGYELEELEFGEQRNWPAHYVRESDARALAEAEADEEGWEL